MLKEIGRVGLVSAGVVVGGMLSALVLVFGAVGLVGFGVSGKLAELEAIMDFDVAEMDTPDHSAEGTEEPDPDDALDADPEAPVQPEEPSSSEPDSEGPAVDEHGPEGTYETSVLSGFIAVVAVFYLFMATVFFLVIGFFLGAFLAALYNVTASITGGLRFTAIQIESKTFKPRGRVAHPRHPVAQRDPSLEAAAADPGPSSEPRS